MLPGEYEDYIAYFRKINRTRLDSLYIGLDFFTTNTKSPIKNEKPSTYFERTGQKFYRFKTTVSFDTMRAYVKKYRDTSYYYQFDRIDGVTVFRKGVSYDMSKLLKDRIELFRKHFYSSENYKYDTTFRKICETIRDRNSDVRLVVFTTPVSKPLFETLVRGGRFEDYCRWIREAVAAFGGIYNFMYINDVKGVNSRLDELQAALLRVKLKYLDEWNLRRFAIAKQYTGALGDTGLILPSSAFANKSSWHLYVIRTPQRDHLNNYLKDKGIGTLIHYPIPPHLQAAYTELGHCPGSFPCAELIAQEVMSLPIGPHLSDEAVEYITDSILHIPEDV